MWSLIGTVGDLCLWSGLHWSGRGYPIMAEFVQDGKQSNSWWLKFEALCMYFSQSDGHTLLELPKTISKVPDGSSLDNDGSPCCMLGQGAEHRHYTEYLHHHDTSGSKRGGHYQRIWAGLGTTKGSVLVWALVMLKWMTRIIYLIGLECSRGTLHWIRAWG